MRDTTFMKRITIELFFIYFILAQPLIDLITALSITYFQSSFTAGTLLRFFMMFLGVVYLFYSKNENKRIMIIYLLILGGFFAISLLNNVRVKDPLLLGEELRFIAKTSYFTILLLTFLLIFKNGLHWGEKALTFVVYAMTIVSGIMVISGLTNTAFDSYEFNKIGHKGWFFAANEIGAILSICFPIVVLYGTRKAKSIRKAYYWIPTLLMVYSLFALGTKVGFGSIIITIIISLFITLIDYLKRKNRALRGNFGTVSFQVLLLLGILLYTPHSAVAHNMNIHFSLLGTSPSTNQTEVQEDESVKKEKQKEQVQNIVLSSRDQYLKLHQDYYKEAPLSQKLLGMGYAGNFEKYPKLIEMDFHDLFFSYGIIGFFVYITPLLLILAKGLLTICRDLKTRFTLENTLIGTGILLGLGISATAGHVMMAPAVSIYLAILMAYMAVKLEIV